MNTHYSFPSIEQYRTVIKTVNDRCSHNQVPRPMLTFHGTVKLHGTNASVVVGSDTYYAQSRSQVITPEADNAGFATFAHRSDVKELLTTFAANAENAYFTTREDHVERYPVNVAIYGEWCGGNIQSGVALNKVGKMFVIFAVRLVSVDGEKSLWLMPWDVESAFETIAQVGPSGRWVTFGVVGDIASFELPIYCIEKFKTWAVDVDFANPALAQNEFVRITEEVERECPVGSAFGVTGVGEGVVWTCVGGEAPLTIRIDDLVFKVKGAKHSDTKVKTVAPIDIEHMNSVKELASSFVTDHRLEKGLAFIAETLHVDNVLELKHIGLFLRWVGTDIVKEETDTIIGNGFDVKEVTKAVNELAKRWFFDKLNERA